MGGGAPTEPCTRSAKRGALQDHRTDASICEHAGELQRSEIGRRRACAGHGARLLGCVIPQRVGEAHLGRGLNREHHHAFVHPVGEHALRVVALQQLTGEVALALEALAGTTRMRVACRTSTSARPRRRGSR